MVGVGCDWERKRSQEARRFFIFYIVIWFFFTATYPPPHPPHLNFSFEKLTLRCQNVKKICMAIKLSFMNSSVLHTFHRNITHSTIITRKTIAKTENVVVVWGGGLF